MYTGKECKKIRTVLGLSAREIGDHIYLTRQCINNIEAERNCSKSSLLLLNIFLTEYAKVKGIDIDKILEVWDW